MCSHFFHSTFGKILGDVVGSIGGFLLGGPVGAAIGGGLAGAGGSAIGGGKLGADILAGATGALGGYGLGEGLQYLGVGGDLLGGAVSGAGDAAGSAAGAAADLGITGTAPLTPVTETPLAGVAPAAQPSAALGAMAAPTAVSEAGAGAVGGPSALTTAPLAGDVGTQADMASAIAAQQGLAGGGVSNVASLADPTTAPFAYPVPAPTTDTVGFDPTLTPSTGTGVGTTLSNLYGDVAGFPQSDLVGASGQYTLPPAFVTPEQAAAGGPAVVDPASGAVVAPGDPNYAQAASLASKATSLAPSPDTQKSTLGSILGSPAGTLAGAAVSGLGLLRAVGQSNKANPIPGMAQVQQIAQQSATQGQILQNYLTTGTLPPAVQASVDQATADGITSIKSKYASMGIAPNSTAEANDIAHLKQNAVVQGATLADQLMQQGIGLTTLSSQLYNDLVGYNTQLNNQTGQAISNLATALSGGGTTLRLNSNNQLVTAA